MISTIAVLRLGLYGLRALQKRKAPLYGRGFRGNADGSRSCLSLSLFPVKHQWHPSGVRVPALTCCQFCTLTNSFLPSISGANGPVAPSHLPLERALCWKRGSCAGCRKIKVKEGSSALLRSRVMPVLESLLLLRVAGCSKECRQMP